MMGLSYVFVKVTVMALSLSQALRDLDTVPSLLESIRLRFPSGKFFLKAEELTSKATQALEKLAVHYEDEKNDKDAYKEPKELRCLRLLDKHLELLMGTEDLQKLFKDKWDDPEMV